MSKIYRILVNKMEQNHHDLSTVHQSQLNPSQDHMSANPSIESIKTIVKSNFLKFGLQKKLLSIILDESSNEKNVNELDKYLEDTNHYLQRCFKSLTHIEKYLKNGGCLHDQLS